MTRRRIDRELAQATAERDLAKARYDAKRFSMAYDALGEESPQSRLRRKPAIEYKGEDDQLPSYSRLAGIGRGRDLRRNFSTAAAMLRQLWINVVGTGQKLRFHTDNAGWNARAQRYFNRVWSRECDGRGGRHLADLERMELEAVLTAGDILCWFDRAGVVPDGGGKLYYWEADQLVEINKWGDAKREVQDLLGVDAVEQYQGVLCDNWGRVLGYVVHPGYGVSVAPRKDCTILPAGDATLLMNPFRPSQRRGTPDLLTIAHDLQDLRELRQAELARKKAQASLALVFKVEDAIHRSIARSDSGDPSSELTMASAAESTAYRNYDNLEKWSAGACEYLEPGETVESFQVAGDSADFVGLTEHAGISAGFALGLTRLHSQGKADASYSASRAEQNLDEALFDVWRKWLERYSLDWKSKRAVGWAINTGRLPDNPDWMNHSWTGWPRTRALNPQQEASAHETDLRNGLADYSDQLGPDWEEKFVALSEQLDLARELGIPLAMLTGGSQNAAPMANDADADGR